MKKKTLGLISFKTVVALSANIGLRDKHCFDFNLANIKVSIIS